MTEVELLTTSLDLKVQRRTPVVPFCIITSGSAWISMADVGLNTEHEKEHGNKLSAAGLNRSEHNGTLCVRVENRTELVQSGTLQAWKSGLCQSQLSGGKQQSYSECGHQHSTSSDVSALQRLSCSLLVSTNNSTTDQSAHVCLY